MSLQYGTVLKLKTIMDKLSLKAEERTILGKKVQTLRRVGLVPGNVYGHTEETEAVTVKLSDFVKMWDLAGETGLINLKIGEERVRPVMIRNVQQDPVKDSIIHVDFYQVNLKEKVTVPVPLHIQGDEPELVRTGEAVVIQPMSEVEVEALPGEIPEEIIVDINALKAIGDVITIADLQVPSGATVLAESDAVVAKLDNAVTQEMQELAEEAAAEAEAATEAEGEGGEAAETTEDEASESTDNEESDQPQDKSPE
jgi:large subunit ribosomal protein L25